MDNIEDLVKKFTCAIISAKNNEKSKLITSLHTFPKGSCGDSSLLLGKYLKEKGFNPKYINGAAGKYKKKPIKSHAWLKVNTIIVDITFGQFNIITLDNNLDNYSYIGKTNAFYKSFKNPEEKYIDFSKYDKRTADNLEKTYKIIKKYL